VRVQSWRRLDPDKVRGGVAIVARHAGLVVKSVRGLATKEELEKALAPYCCFAELTLLAGAFDYPKTDTPTNAQVIEVMIDFLRAVGQATAKDEILLRTAMLSPDLADALRSPA
jgi:hypothetical protein